MHTLRIVRVTKRYPGVIANDAVSLTIRAGEVHALLGENGAGKSTLIAILAGLVQPDAGKLYIDESPVVLPTPRAALEAGIGTVFQHGMLIPSLTVADNLVLGGRWWQRPRRQTLEARASLLADSLGIDLPLAVRVDKLSLGEQQQVEIVRALLCNRAVLVLDEATSMLTPSGVDELGRLMRRLAETGMAVVFISHKLDEACRFGDRISVLRHGRNAGEFSPEQVKTTNRNEIVQALIRCMFDPLSTAGTATRRQPEAVPADARVVLDVRGVTVSPADGTPGLDAITCRLHAGEILGVAGIDGNGQTELAQVLAGQRTPEHGEIRLCDERIDTLGVRERRHRGMRYVSDDRLGEGTVASFPVVTNLFLKDVGRRPFWRWGIARHALMADAARARVREFDVRTPDIHTPVGHLSGGNVQKLILARELSAGASIVIFHKPTYGLDAKTGAAIHDRMIASAASGAGVLIISTDLDELIALCHRILVMVNGKVVGSVGNQGATVRRAVGALMTGGHHR